MIFLTVGTQFPFDRLVKAVDDAFHDGLLGEEIFAQVGESSYRPRNFESVRSLDKSLFDQWMQNASAVISHAGMGTTMGALDNAKPLLVMPRQKKYGEVVNDHQMAIAKRFAELGYVLVAYDAKDLPEGIRRLRNFAPRKRKADLNAVADRINHFLNTLSKSRLSEDAD